MHESDKTWRMAYAHKSTTFTENGVLDLEGRLFMHFGCICVSPTMAVTVAGGGSDHAMAAADTNGQALDGAETDKLHLPPDMPVKDFWAVAVYDTQTRSQLQTQPWIDQTWRPGDLELA